MRPIHFCLLWGGGGRAPPPPPRPGGGPGAAPRARAPPPPPLLSKTDFSARAAAIRAPAAVPNNRTCLLGRSQTRRTGSHARRSPGPCSRALASNERRFSVYGEVRMGWGKIFLGTQKTRNENQKILCVCRRNMWGIRFLMGCSLWGLECHAHSGQRHRARANHERRISVYVEGVWVFLACIGCSVWGPESSVLSGRQEHLSAL